MTHSPARLVVAGSDSAKLESLARAGRLLAAAHGCPLQILGLVAVPEGESLSSGALGARRMRESLEPLVRGHTAELAVRVAHDLWSELAVAIAELPGSQLLMYLDGAPPPEALARLNCDVALLAGTMPDAPKRILLPVRGGPYAQVALGLASALADANDAEITVLHAASPSRLGDELYQVFLKHLGEIPSVTRWVNIRGDVVKAVAAEAHTHDLLIMGAVARARPEESVAGPVTLRAVEAAGIPALVIRAAAQFPLAAAAAVEELPLDHTISVVVDKWFAENSFHASEFADLSRLMDLKRRQGLTISLGLPTLNEAATIRKVIETIKGPLMDETPLLDEIVVVDSLSTDDTVAIAESLGVPVYRHPEIMPEVGSHRGKGEALWKSLAVLRGDLIAWIDTDISNIHPRFVYGVLGPLICNPALEYVKAYYQRPLKKGDVVEIGEGGRVTELVARPLLNLFFPELSGVVQPLSGEYAGRRRALTQVPFFTGYGVEIGLLIDLMARFGLGAIGQVDLEERVHRNQPLSALSRMSFAIIQVVMQRLGQERGLALMDEMQRSLKQILFGDEHFELEVRAIRDSERPPIAGLLGY